MQRSSRNPLHIVLIVASMIVPLFVVVAMRPVDETVLVPGKVRAVSVVTDNGEAPVSPRGGIFTVAADERHPRYAEWLWLKRQDWYATREDEDPILRRQKEQAAGGFGMSLGPRVISVRTNKGVRLVADVMTGKGQLHEVQKVASYVGAKMAGQRAFIEGDGVVVGDPNHAEIMGAVIVAANGTPVRSTFDFDRVVQKVGPGGTVEAEVSGAEEPLPIVVPKRSSADVMSYGLSGIYMWTANQRITTERLVYFENDGEASAKVEGPSGGLSYSLAVYAALATTDVVDGRRIVATGIVAPDGRVSPVFGVGAKTIAAREDGADIFFVPKAEEAKSRRFAGPNMKVVGVVFAQEAGDYLKRTSRGKRVS